MKRRALPRVVCVVAMLLIAAEAAATRWIIPAAAHVAGAAGTNWRTDLRIVNPGDGAVTARVHLLPANQDNSALDRHFDVTIPAGGQVQVGDVLATRFAFSGSAALLVDSSADELLVTSRTYNQVPGGTYGQFIPGVAESDALGIGVTGHIAMLAKAPDRRSNLGFANVSGDSGTVVVRLYDNSGAEIGFKSSTIPPWGQTQHNDVFAVAGAAARNVARAEVFGSVPLVAYASVIDQSTGDPVAVMAVREPTEVAGLVLPAAARAAGVGGSLWRTDLRIYNPTASTANVSLAYHAKGVGGAPAATVNRQVAAGAILALDDLMSSAFGLQTANGGVRITANVPLIAISRTYNQSDDGTYGQSIPAAGVSELVQAGQVGLFSGLSNVGFRSNVGFFNVGSLPVDLALELVGASGAVTASGSWRVLAGEMDQITNVFSFLGAGGATGDGPYSLRVTAPAGGPYAAFVSVVDNLSGDPVYEAATAVAGGGGGGGGTGECITLDFPSPGITVTSSIQTEVEGQQVTGSLSTTYVSTTATQARALSVLEYSVAGINTRTETETTEEYKVLANPVGYIAVDRVDTVATTTVLGFQTTTTTRETFSPALMVGPGTRWCDGEEWTTPSVTETVIVNNGTPEVGPTDSWNGVVDAVDQPLTTPAGSFVTVVATRLLTSGEDAGGWVRTWTDVATGVMVRQEIFAQGGERVGFFEATSIN